MLMQAGAVVVRRVTEEPEYLLITSGSGKWIFPKGLVERDETFQQAALKEVREEAGVEGVLQAEPLEEYTDEKWLRKVRVRMFLMEYSGDSAVWPEADSRQRRWLSFDEALARLKKRKLRRVLEAARDRVARMGWDSSSD